MRGKSWHAMRQRCGKEKVIFYNPPNERSEAAYRKATVLSDWPR